MRSRLEQVYIWVMRELNRIGVTIGGRTLTRAALDDIDSYLEPSEEELVTFFAALVAEGVRF